MSGKPWRRGTHLLLFYALFAIVFTIALALVGTPERRPQGEGTARLSTLPLGPVDPQPRDPWFDYPAPDDPRLNRHVPALRGIVYSETIHDMPEPTPESP